MIQNISNPRNASTDIKRCILPGVAAVVAEIGAGETKASTLIVPILNGHNFKLNRKPWPWE
jgi:hypothetical protein